MGFDSKGLDDYIDVAQRIAEFRVKHPEGSLQPLNPAQPFEIRELTGTDKSGKEQRGTFIIYTAAAYRSPEDQRPGVGCAYEVFPGRTPYTAGSELQNAETAAWGRAIVAVLAADTRAGIASQQEVRNRQAERGDSAGDVFEQAAPVRPMNQGPREATRPAVAAAQGPASPENQAWVTDALARAAAFTTRDEGLKLHAELADRVHAGLVSKPDADRIARQIKAHGAVIQQTAQETAAQTTALDPEDEWAAVIDGISCPEDADPVLADAAGQLGDGTITKERFTQIEAAVQARLNAVPGEVIEGVVAA